MRKKIIALLMLVLIVLCGKSSVFAKDCKEVFSISKNENIEKKREYDLEEDDKLDIWGTSDANGETYIYLLAHVSKEEKASVVYAWLYSIANEEGLEEFNISVAIECGNGSVVYDDTNNQIFMTNRDGTKASGLPDWFISDENEIRMSDEEIEALYTMILNNFADFATEENSKKSEENNETIILDSGIYVAGEDIDEGKYDLIAISGSGLIYIYNSFDSYDSGESFDSYFRLCSRDSEKLEKYSDMYSSSVSNLRLTKGKCLVIDSGLQLEMVAK